eukprot:c10141_g1_i1.p1 GENE.c10141_g1_i1~~c10141_g1_i1.p1  ORF type:complete len:965 (+),score=211.13 c10141_g1_i1:30-2924(+)
MLRHCVGLHFLLVAIGSVQASFKTTGVSQVTWATKNPDACVGWLETHLLFTKVSDPECTSQIESCKCVAATCSLATLNLKSQPISTSPFNISLTNCACDTQHLGMSFWEYEQAFQTQIRSITQFDPLLNFNLGFWVHDLQSLVDSLEHTNQWYFPLVWNDSRTTYYSIMVNPCGTVILDLFSSAKPTTLRSFVATNMRFNMLSGHSAGWNDSRPVPVKMSQETPTLEQDAAYSDFVSLGGVMALNNSFTSPNKSHITMYKFPYSDMHFQFWTTPQINSNNISTINSRLITVKDTVVTYSNPRDVLRKCGMGCWDSRIVRFDVTANQFTLVEHMMATPNTIGQCTVLKDSVVLTYISQDGWSMVFSAILVNVNRAQMDRLCAGARNKIQTIIMAILAFVWLSGAVFAARDVLQFPPFATDTQFRLRKCLMFISGSMTLRSIVIGLFAMMQPSWNHDMYRTLLLEMTTIAELCMLWFVLRTFFRVDQASRGKCIIFKRNKTSPPTPQQLEHVASARATTKLTDSLLPGQKKSMWKLKLSKRFESDWMDWVLGLPIIMSACWAGLLFASLSCSVLSGCHQYIIARYSLCVVNLAFCVAFAICFISGPGSKHMWTTSRIRRMAFGCSSSALIRSVLIYFYMRKSYQNLIQPSLKMENFWFELAYYVFGYLTADCWMIFEFHSMVKLGLGANDDGDHFISHEFITLGEVIGRGATSVVYFALVFHEKVACKVMNVTDITAMSGIVREAVFHASLKHPNIVEFKKISVSYPEFYLLTELCEQSLCCWLKIRQVAEKRMLVLLEICAGMKFLHGKHITHRDLKVENVLLDSHETVKICDFGAAKSLHTQAVTRQLTLNVGSYLFMAPELLQDNGQYTRQIDVFSFAIVMWCVCANKSIPYDHVSLAHWEIALQVKDQGLRPPRDSKIVGDRLWALMESCWDANPANRPSFANIETDLQSMFAEPPSTVLLG